MVRNLVPTRIYWRGHPGASSGRRAFLAQVPDGFHEPMQEVEAIAPRAAVSREFVSGTAAVEVGDVVAAATTMTWIGGGRRGRRRYSRE